MTTLFKSSFLNSPKLKHLTVDTSSPSSSRTSSPNAPITVSETNLSKRLKFFLSPLHLKENMNEREIINECFEVHAVKTKRFNKPFFSLCLKLLFRGIWEFGRQKNI